ncbi:MAG: YihY/virulence factor BrkB family protein [Patulibacter sp.]
MRNAHNTTGQPSRLRTAASVTWSAGKQLGGGGTDRAAALAYYAVQAIFPGLFVLAFISLRLSTEQSIAEALNWGVKQGLDPSLAESLHHSLADASNRARGTAGLAAIIAAITAISGASGWFAAAGRAIEPDPALRRSRNLIVGKLRPAAWTLLLIALLVAALTLLAGGRQFADQLFDLLGASSGAPLAWRIAQWPLVLGGIVATMLLLYRVAPDRLHPTPVRHLLHGAIVAGCGWVIASLAFFYYISNLASIGSTYGAFATPIVLLLWLYLSGVVVLFGAAINSELARRRGELHRPVSYPGADDPEIAGHPAGRLPTAEDLP